VASLISCTCSIRDHNAEKADDGVAPTAQTQIRNPRIVPSKKFVM
jgi:hypothetical protein